MKYLIILLLIIPTFASAQYDNFKYKGEFPTKTFTKDNYDEVTTDMRNRIFVRIEETGSLFLNNHKIPFEDYEKHLKYILSNPDELVHLPKSPQEAVLCLDAPRISRYTSKDKSVEEFHTNFIYITSFKVYSDIITKSIEKPISQLSLEDIGTLSTNLIVTIATPSSVNYEEETVEEAAEEEYIYEEEVAMEEVPEYEEVEEAVEEVEEYIYETEAVEAEETYEYAEVSNYQVALRNIFSISIDENQNIFAKGEQLLSFDELYGTLSRYIKKEAESTEEIIISLEKDKAVSSKYYKEVGNVITKVYHDIWDLTAKQEFGKPFKKLSEEKQRLIQETYPMNILEKGRTSF